MLIAKNLRQSGFVPAFLVVCAMGFIMVPAFAASSVGGGANEAGKHICNGGCQGTIVTCTTGTGACCCRPTAGGNWACSCKAPDDCVNSSTHNCAP